MNNYILFLSLALITLNLTAMEKDRGQNNALVPAQALELAVSNHQEEHAITVTYIPVNKEFKKFAVIYAYEDVPFLTLAPEDRLLISTSRGSIFIARNASNELTLTNMPWQVDITQGNITNEVTTLPIENNSRFICIVNPEGDVEIAPALKNT